MSNFSFLKPGQNEAVRRNLDGTYLPQTSLASPFTGRSLASPYTRLAQDAIWDKIQHKRTVYTVDPQDLGSPFMSGIWSVNWDDPYADSNYSVLVSAEDLLFSQSSPAMTPPSILVTSKTAGAVQGRLSFHPYGYGSGRAITINVCAWHD